MEDPKLDLDRLATHLRNEIERKGLSVRGASAEIGCSPATLARLLQGAAAPNVPDAINLMRAASWLGKSLSEFEAGKTKTISTIGDVEVHLRALPNISKSDAEGLVGMVKAAYDVAAKFRSKKNQGR